MAEKDSGVPLQMKNAFPTQLNGVHSAHSSRGHSPVARSANIPPSQLPPMKHNIPLSQLPPLKPSVSEVTQKVGELFVSEQSTPNISPKSSIPSPQHVSTQKPYFSQNISPIPPLSVPNTFHQSQSAPVLGSVPLNSTSAQNVKNNNFPVTAKQFSNPSQSARIPLITNQTTQNAVPQNLSNNFSQRMPVNANPSQTVSQGNQNIFGKQVNGPIQQYPPFTTNMTTNNQNVGSLSNFSASIPGNFGNIPTSGPAAPQNFQPITTNYLPPQPSNGPVGMTSQGIQNTAVPKSHFQSQTSTPGINYNITPHAVNQPSSINGTQPPVPSTQTQYRPNLHTNRYPTPTAMYQSSSQGGYLSQQSTPFPTQNTPQLQQPVLQSPAFQQPQQPEAFQQQFLQKSVQPQHPIQNTDDSSYAAQQLHQAAYQGLAGSGFSRYWGTESIDLLQNPNILPTTKLEAPQIHLGQDNLNQANCSPDIFRATMTKIPANNSLLQKSRLPLGVLIHPFKDLSHLPVIQCNVIVRCRACRTYINPFVYFTDSKRWKCNLCYRINELPEEFQYDPVSKTYGDPSRRPEIKASTIEYIAPAEYMLRPPQPAVYLFLFDISRLAVESGYLSVVCNILLEELSNLPGDARTQIGFLAYDSAVHFFSLADGLNQPHEMTVLDIDDIFLPTPDNLLVNLKDRTDMIHDLLQQLPNRYSDSFDNNSALGAALQAAYKMTGATGGRVTVFQCALPNFGPGALASREDPSNRASVEVAHLNPANDFYKRLALECSGQQIAVDLFILNSQYVDIATISGISRFSGGCITHFPLFKSSKPLQTEGLERSLRRYLTRKIGFEAVMRVRCTRGLSIHTFHGNFFVRSTDLLSLPNVNPDTGFGMQVAIEESLSDVQTVCFQAALLYTSSKGERRIRVHTLCLPIASTLHEIIHSADQQTIIGLLAKMAVDRSMQANLSDAREAFINVAIDILSSYKFSLNLGSSSSGLLAPNCLKLLPLYISALLKHTAFRIGTSTRLDDRVKAMIDMKCKPLNYLIQMIYPDLYPIHNLESQEVILNADEEPVPLPPRIQLTARCLENKGAFLMDTGDHMLVLVCPSVSQQFLNEALGVADYNSITDQMYEVPVLENPLNQRLRLFINYLNEEKPFTATIQVLRDNSPGRMVFFERLIEDRVENALSYHEFLQHLKTQVK